MKKQAGVINNAFIAMDAVDGAKKVGKAYKQTNTTYSDPLGTTIKKTSPKMGAANAEIANPKLASEAIDELCKVAIAKTPLKKAIIHAKLGKRNLGRGLDRIDAANTQHIKNAINAVKNKQLVRGVSEAGKASLVTVPAVAGMIAAGKGTEKMLEKFDKNSKQPENELERKVIGAGVTGALLLNAATGKRVIKPGVTALNIAGTKSVKYPMNAVRKTRAGKVVGDFVKQVGNQGSKAAKAVDNANAQKMMSVARAKTRDMDFLKGKLYDLQNGKQKLDPSAAFNALLSSEQRKVLKDGALKGMDTSQVANNWNKRKQYLSQLFDEYINSKNASSEIDDLEKLAGKKTEFAKHLAVDHFLKEGLKSIPYYTAPAALGFMLNRDIKNGLKKFSEKESPKEQLKEDLKSITSGGVEKVAGIPFIDKQKIMNAVSKENIKRLTTKESLKKGGIIALEKGADGLGRTIFPATVTAITGRNIMNSFKKLEDSHGVTPQEDMANRIIIQINGEPTKRKLKSQVSKEIDKKYSINKQASFDIGDVLKEIHKERENADLKREKESKGASKLTSKKVHVGNGVKKTFRMNN